MRRMILLAAAAGLLAATGARAGQAPAQPSAPVPAAQAGEPDPVRLQLARELLEASGGRQSAEATLNLMFGGMAKLAATGASKEADAFTGQIMADVKDEILAMVPELLDLSARVYAGVYTEQELRDYLAWLRSPSGRSVAEKAPLLRRQILDAEMPMMMAMKTRLIPKVLDRVCERSKCSPADRKQLDEIMSRMMATSKS